MVIYLMDDVLAAGVPRAVRAVRVNAAEGMFATAQEVELEPLPASDIRRHTQLGLHGPQPVTPNSHQSAAEALHLEVRLEIAYTADPRFNIERAVKNAFWTLSKFHRPVRDLLLSWGDLRN